LQKDRRTAINTVINPNLPYSIYNKEQVGEERLDTGDLLNHPFFGLEEKGIKENKHLTSFSYLGDGSSEIRLAFHLCLEEKDREELFILEAITEYFNKRKNNNQNTYKQKQTKTEYGNFDFTWTSFSEAKKIINYFDRFHLLSSKHVNYLKWRKAYIIIQNKKHLTYVGLERLIKLHKSINRNNF
jgi:hypothetical protein